MALINYATREINAKIVYYGPGLSGKTTNIHYVFKKVRPDNKGRLISLATQGDRTLFFDFLPVELGNIKGFKTRFHLYTVPGQVFYNSTRKMVLKGSDGVVFVADSQKMMMDENLQSLENLKANLRDMGLEFANFPVVFQFNKRDLPNAAPVEDINGYLNPGGLPYFEASAISGDGVLKTLTGIVKYVLHDLKEMPDTHSLDFGAIEEAAGFMVEGASETLWDGNAEPAARPAPPARPETPARPAPSARPAPAAVRATEAADTRPDITEPIKLDTAGRRVEKAPAKAVYEVRDEAPEEGAEVELPEASPEVFSALGGPVDDVMYDSDEMIEGLGEMIADAENLPPHEVSGALYDLDDLQRDELPEPTTYDTHPAPAGDTLADVLETYPQAAPLTEHDDDEPAIEAELDIPEEFYPNADLTSGLEMPASGVKPIEPDAHEKMPVAPAAESKPDGPKPATMRLKKTFNVPVRLDTSTGVKEVVLSLNVDLDITGDGLDAVQEVKLGQPVQVHVEDVKGPSMHEKDPSKHPPPPISQPEKPAPAGTNEPALRIYKKGIFDKMFGR
jgi:mutual gliding-motility protein MglA